ncbi:GntR family transcriptional regulator [Bordetella bronchiseptica]|uniref:GntR family transcriptional regulator n=1 Tax=Bordetella bronchiseptica TaxID=518 RepID=UPI000528C0FA|nr:GntR family transcriptional regulator [Bordetella bronchiseptica]
MATSANRLLFAPIPPSMNMPLAPMARENIAAVIYRQLKQLLMMGELKPGEILTLRMLTERLGVSQTPVREALLQLVSERALAMSRGKSVSVPAPTREKLQELRDIRLTLEVLATERATPRISDAEIKTLERLHREMVRYKNSEQREGVLKTNYEFHFTLYNASGMPDLVAIIEGLWAQTGPSLTYLYQKPFAHLYDTHPHLPLIEALRRHDVEAAVAAIRRDVAGYGAALMERLPAEAGQPAGG